MRLFCLIVIFFASYDFASAISRESLPEVFRKLYPEYTLNKYQNDKWTFKKEDAELKLKIIDFKRSKNSYAYFSKDHARNILITRALIDDLANSEELAFLLAHEMSHLDLGHYCLPNFSSYVFSKEQERKISEHLQSLELLADSSALDLLKKSGFNSEKGLALLEKKFNADRESFFKRHPNLKTRISSGLTS